MTIKISFFAFACTLVWALFTGCLQDGAPPSGPAHLSGGIAPVVLFKRPAAPVLDIPSQVVTVRMRIRGLGLDTSVDFPYSLHYAEISGVPEGMVTFIVEGLDLDDEVIYRAEDLIEVIADSVVSPEIILESTNPIILTFTSPKNGDTVNVASTTLSGILFTDNSLVLFEMDGSQVSVSGNLWSENAILTEGKNSFIFQVWDNKGNGLTETLVIYYSKEAVDNAGPALTITLPRDNDTVSIAAVSITGTVNDPSGVLSVTVNGAQAAITGTAWTRSQTLAEGPNVITILATDLSPAGNKTQKVITVHYNPLAVDITPPYITIDVPSNGDTVSSPVLQVSGTVIDNSGVQSVTVNGAAAVLAPDGGWTAEITLESGVNKVIVAAVDKSLQANVRRDTISVRYDADYIDTEPPTIRITQPSNLTMVGTASGIRVSGTASDGSGIDSVTVNGITASWDGSAWAATIDLPGSDTNLVWAVAVDTKGNRDSASIVIIYDPAMDDVTGPSIVFESPENGQRVGSASVLVQLSVNDPGSGVGLVMIQGQAADTAGGRYVREVPLNEGVNVISVSAADKSSSPNTSVDSIIVTYDPTLLDTIAPKITLIAPSAQNPTVGNSAFLIRVSVNDLESGVKWVEIGGTRVSKTNTWYEQTVSLGNGPNSINVIACDNSTAANKDTLAVRAVLDTTLLDHTPPVLELLLPAAQGQTVGSPDLTIRVSVSDPGSGVAWVEIGGVRVNKSGAYYQGTVALDSGENTIPVTAEDLSPNNNPATLQVNVVYDPTLNDHTPPEISLESHTDGELIAGADVTIRASVTDNASSVAWVKMNGLNAVKNGGFWEKSFTLTHASNPITISAQDGSSNKNIDSVVFILRREGIGVDLAGHYQFGVNGATNLIPENQTSSLLGGVQSVPDRFNQAEKAYSFDGVEDYITISNHSSNVFGAEDFTLSIWFRLDDFNGSIAQIFGKKPVDGGSFYELEVGSNYKVRFAMGTTASSGIDVSSGVPVLKGLWYNAVVVRSDSYLSMYLNGSRSSLPRNTATTLSDEADPIYFGTDNYRAVKNSVPEFFNGCMDNLRIYKRALSEAEIGLLYAEGGWKGNETISPKGMRRITGGTFQMGSANGEVYNRPIHSVTISTFWLDTTEVTQADYEAVTGTAPWNDWTVSNPALTGVGSNLPAWHVNWFHAALYCNLRSKIYGFDTVYTYTGIQMLGNDPALENLQWDFSKNGFHLPTEAQWEYAARAGTTTDYYWGKNAVNYPVTQADNDEISLHAVWARNSSLMGSGNPGYGLHPVASHQPNAFFLYDMSGNLMEWVNDYFADDYYSQLSPGATDPEGPPVSGWVSQPTMKVARGGYWMSFAEDLSSGARLAGGDAHIRDSLRGFRVAR